MTDNTRRVSELSQTANAAQSDRVVILKNPTVNASLRTITVGNLTTSLTKATQLTPGIVRVGNGLSVDANGTVSTTGGGAPIAGVVTVATAGHNTYSVSANDSVIFVNPTVVGSNVTIVLPIAAAIEGKEILVKLVDADGDYKVTITTDDPGNAYLEDPITGAFDHSYELVQTGQAETWIHDGNVYRHLATARATPIFHTDANTYAQVVVTNASNGENASVDLVLYNDKGDYEAGTGPLIDLGINSSRYSNSIYSIGSHNDGYLFVDNGGFEGGNLAIGVSQDKSILFHAGGTTSNDVVMVVNTTSIGIVNTVIKEVSGNNLYINNPNNAIQLGASWLTQISATQNSASVWGGGNTQAYTWVYQEPENYAEAYSYIQANNRWADFGITTSIGQAFKVTTSKPGLGTALIYDFNGILHLDPTVGDIQRNGVSVIGTGQIDGGNAFTTPTAEITVDGGGA